MAGWGEVCSPKEAMSVNRTRRRSGASVRTMRRSQIVITVTVLLSVMTAWTMLGYSGGLQAGSGRARTDVKTASPASLTANPKEYIYAGARLIATEECSLSISPASTSFPATQPPSGGNQSGSFNVTAAAGCSWPATSNATFVTITNGGSGTGNGTVNYSVTPNAGPTIRNGTISVNDQTFTVYQGINFTDVPTNDPFYTDIGKLAARGVTLGCGGGNYCPATTVTRDTMSAFILRAKGEFDPPTPPTQRFTDVPPTNVFYNFIDRLAVLQITLGCGGGNYCPASPVLREQMAAFLIRALGEFDPPTPLTQRFADVSPPDCTPPCSPNVFYNFIDRMAVLNITQGCASNPLRYCPADTVTRAQMAAFLVRAFNL
jgi:S-layer family protein